MASGFVDTNLLVYAAYEVVPVPRKTRIARELLLRADLCISVQVLNEFTANARSPRKLNFSSSKEKEWIDRWLQLKILPLTVGTFLAAQTVYARHGLSHWDSLIVACAIRGKCPVLYSEDLNHGQDYSGVRVINPFKG